MISSHPENVNTKDRNIFQGNEVKNRKKKPKKQITPSSYGTMPHYFPTEQVDIVDKIKKKKKIKRYKPAKK